MTVTVTVMTLWRPAECQALARRRHQLSGCGARTGWPCGGWVGSRRWAAPDSVPLPRSTSAASRPRWTPTTRPRTPAPGAASTLSSATTVWPSRAPPGPSGPGCRRPLSSTSPSHPRPRATRGLPAARAGDGEGDPRWPSQAPVTDNAVLRGCGGGRAGRVGGTHLTYRALELSEPRALFVLGVVGLSPSQAHVQRHVSC